MKPWLLIALLLGAAGLLTAAGPTLAQDPVASPADTVAAPADPSLIDLAIEPELSYDDYSIKAYTLSIFGGPFYGDEYLNLPLRGDRTFEDEGADNVMSYDGDWLLYDREVHDAPVKTLEDATGVGAKVGAWLNDNVHIDLTLSYVATEAVLTMINKSPDTPAPDDMFREEMSRDDGVSVYRAGLALNYELRQFELLGIHPYVGFGFGGVITRFSQLDDTSELFFNGILGFSRPIAENLTLFAQYDLTTFAMDRDELHYTKRVQFSDLRFGIGWYLDVVPAEIRALHEAELADEEHGRRR